MPHDDLAAQLQRLLTGLADQETLAGAQFLYDGATLYPDEVADLLLPSVLCLAQDLSRRLGMGTWGYAFALGAPEAVGFPLLVRAPARGPLFLEVAPFATQVFTVQLMACRDDVARLFEAAARLVRPEFSLVGDTNHGRLSG